MEKRSDEWLTDFIQISVATFSIRNICEDTQKKGKIIKEDLLLFGFSSPRYSC